MCDQTEKQAKFVIFCYGDIKKPFGTFKLLGYGELGAGQQECLLIRVNVWCHLKWVRGLRVTLMVTST
jgi:hypothetical protein